MLKRLLTLAVCAAGLAAASAAEENRPITFTKDVLPIMQENCQNCHRPAGVNISGMIAPMSLVTYDEVRPWSKAIVRAVTSKQMPPWKATGLTAGHFRNERTLSDDEIRTIEQWAATGAARGNPDDAPEPVMYPDSGWGLSATLGEPDMLIEMPEPYWVGDDIQDIQPDIAIQLTRDQLAEQRWVQGIEFKPGSDIVHHIVGYSVPPGQVDDGINRTNFGQIGSGTDPQSYDAGYGLPLEPESTIVLSLHYHKEAGPGTGVFDQSQVAVWFHDKPVEHELESAPIAHRDFEIPPGVNRWRVGGTRTWNDDFVLIEMVPHTHLRGTAAKYTAMYPDGTSEVLLDVPAYDYNWQTQYTYQQYRTMPAGTRIEWEVWFDNSAETAAERNFNSERAVKFGLPTTDEMDLGWVTWCYAEEGKQPEKHMRGGRPTIETTEKESD